MTNECARKNDEARPVEPVTEWENRDSDGYALCDEYLFREHVEKTEARRNRQAAYRDSLPTDPGEALRAAFKLMHPDLDEYPDGVEEALHLSFAFEAMVRSFAMDGDCATRDATLYVAARVSSAMLRATSQLDRLSDILSTRPRSGAAGKARVR